MWYKIITVCNENLIENFMLYWLKILCNLCALLKIVQDSTKVEKGMENVNYMVGYGVKILTKT